jgi:sarcosine oxidase
MKDPLGTARALGRRFTLYPIGDRSWKDAFPFFDFPDGYSVFHEPTPAGYINPRDLIRAQLICAERAGATIVRATATRIHRIGGTIEIETDAEGKVRADKVIVAAGAFTNCHDLLPKKLAFELETESILLARVSDEDGVRLAGAPAVIYLVDDTEIWDIYMTPPIRYPDGRYYVKLGANSVHDAHPATLDELGAWFRNGDSDRAKEAMTRALRSLWPDLDFLSMETRRCVITRTPSGYPIIDQVDDGVYVAAGGNGGSAKSSDALGRLAVTVARGESWPPEIPSELFRAQYATS